jgi:hypothetical protein
VDVGYTTQVAIAATHHRVVGQELSHAVTDVDPRSGMASHAQEAVAVEPRTVAAEMGYSHGAALTTGAEAGIAPDGATPFTAATRPLGRVGTEPCP